MLRKFPQSSPLTLAHSPSSTESMTYGDAPREQPIPREIDIHRELNRMEELVLDSPRVPLSRLALVDEERLLEQLDAIRLALPSILQNALTIVHQKDSILQETEQYAQEIIASAERQAMNILDEMGIIRQAEREANQTRQQLQQECTVIREELLAEMEQIRRQAQQEADDLRQMAIAECQDIQQGADEYAEQVLHDMEQHLSAMLTVIRNGRQQLQGPEMDETPRRLGS